ncbi:MAG: helix-hairpin-helix domain-containing protein [Dysgonamonadaceae bacterium]|nr:helix-hairpin-helix domain-containing protein [Dysgonamonadaceae bacterium]
MKKWIFLFLAVLIGAPLAAQLNKNNTKWMEYLEEMSDNDDVDEQMLENLTSDLSYLSEHPLNLNTISKKDLERLPFLSDLQIESILAYVHEYAPLTGIYELRNIPDLDMQTIEYILPFVYTEVSQAKKDPLSVSKILRNGKHELLTRYDYCFQEKSGYKAAPEEEKNAHPNRYYLGEKYYASFKYGFNYKERVQLGLVGEKDPGEAFWNKHHKGFDYYSAHLALRDFGLLKNLVLGDYRLSFGQGLVLNTDFPMLRTSDVINVNKKASGIKRHYSTNETNAFRGLAFSLGWKRTTLSLFYSRRKSDASANDSTVFSFKTDGYRQTPNDLLKKDQATKRLLGGNILWQNNLIAVGLTGVYYDFNGKYLNPDLKPYNIHYLRGEYNYNAGIHYLFRKKKFIFQGETAIGKNGAVAYLNTMLAKPLSSVNFVLLHRYFPMNYQSEYSSMAGSSTLQNESGYYIGATFAPFLRWKFSASVDFVEYPWLKYQVDAPSHNTDVLLNVDYIPSSTIQMSLRYKQKKKDKNITLPSQLTKAILPTDRHSLRYQINCRLSSHVSTKTQANLSLYQLPEQAASKGYMLSQSITYRPQKVDLQGDLYMAYFRTDNWDTRISAYEKNILYVFSVPSFYGEGLRACLTLRWTWTKNLSFYAKGAWTHYFDRDVIGSSLEEIEGKEKTDVYCLVKWKF